MHSVETAEKDAARITAARGRLPAWTGPAAASLVALLVLVHRIDRPYIGHHDWNAAWISSAARSYLDYGYFALRFGVMPGADRVPAEWFEFYTSHPPLVPLLVSLSFHLFGEHAWAARLVPVLFTLGSIALVYLLAAALAGRPAAVLAACGFALLPAIGYFGQMVNHEAVAGFFMLATALAYLRWDGSRRGRWFGAMLACLVLGMLSAWPAYFLAGILPLHHLLATPPARRTWKVLVLPAAALAMFAVHLAHVALLQGSAGLDTLGRVFLSRTQLVPLLPYEAAGPTAFGWLAFLAREANWAVQLFTVPILLLALLALYDLVRGRSLLSGSAAALLLGLLLAAALHVVLFSEAAWVHNYWLFYFAAPLAILAAVAARSLARAGAGNRIVAVLGLLFLVAAVPKTRALFGIQHERIPVLAQMLSEHTRPGEMVLTNSNWLASHPPQVGYYARRDVWQQRVDGTTALERLLEERAHRSFAFVLVENDPGGSELRAWLDARYDHSRAHALGAIFLIYRIPAP